MNEYLISSFSQQWKKDPTSRVFFRLAEEYRKGGSYDKAIEVCSQGVLHHPNYLPALLCLGRCHQQLGHLVEAEEVFRKVLAFSPDNVRVLGGLSKICFDSNRFDEARRLLEILLNNEPNDENARALLAQIIQKEQPKEVEAAFGSDLTEIEEADLASVPDDEMLEDSAFDLVADDDLLEEEAFVPESEALSPSPLALEDAVVEEPLAMEEIPWISKEEPETLAKSDELATELEPTGILDNEEEVQLAEEEEIRRHDLSEEDPLEEMAIVNMDPPNLASSSPRQLLPGNSNPLDALDLHFEKAIQDADKQTTGLFQEPVSAKKAGPEPLSKKEEEKLTRGLKQEKMEHFEAAQHIYRSLLQKHPGDRLVSGHLERVNSRLATESKPNKQIRLLSNWLDKIKGVYYVR